jgi:hypothetical protein
MTMPPKDAVAVQAATIDMTTRQIMASAAFAAGVADVRAGKPTRFDSFKDDWGYERGRQWALIAPMSMPLRLGRKLNPEALLLFDLAWLRREIV